MKKQRIYFHVLEYGHYGNIGYQGLFFTLQEAQKQVDRLSDFFPDLTFTIFQDTSKKEPPIVTI